MANYINCRQSIDGNISAIERRAALTGAMGGRYSRWVGYLHHGAYLNLLADFGRRFLDLNN